MFDVITEFVSWQQLSPFNEFVLLQFYSLLTVDLNHQEHHIVDLVA